MTFKLASAMCNVMSLTDRAMEDIICGTFFDAFSVYVAKILIISGKESHSRAESIAAFMYLISHASVVGL